MKHYSSFLSFVVLAFLGGALIVHAQGYTPLAPLPGTTVTGGEGTGTTNISTYVAGSIKLLIALGAGLAVLFAIVGGTQYVAASINPAAKAGAIERIQNSFVGLAIILSSYLVLNSINPDLVNFKLELPPVTAEHTVSISVGGSSDDASGCPTITETSVILNTPEAQQMERGATVIFTSGDSAAQANLTKLKQETDKLLLALSQIGMSGEVTSAYRPYEYQKHLYEIYDAWVVRGLRNDNRSQCASSKTIVGTESQKHFGSNGPGLVANPDTGSAPHLAGRGVDIKINFGSTGASYGNFTMFGHTDINKFMINEGIYLSWQGLANDKVHFNLRNR